MTSLPSPLPFLLYQLGFRKPPRRLPARITHITTNDARKESAA